MSPLRLMVDVELLIVDHLRTVPDLADVEIHTAFGPGQTWPAVRIIRIGGTRPWPPHIDRARIQVEGWAETKAAALNATETTLSALLDMGGVYDQGVVSGVDVGLAPAWSPDPDTDLARYTADVLVTVHPHIGGIPDGS